MPRKKSFFQPIADEPSLDISSMIDVCFLLLIYFLATSTITPRESDLAVTIPVTKNTGIQPPIPPLSIRIAADGIVFSGIGPGEQALDKDPTSRDLPLLVSQLDPYREASRAAGSEPQVRLGIDLATSQQRVVDVLNALGGGGIANVGFVDLL